MKNEELRSSSFFILHSKFFIPPPSNHRHGRPELLPRPLQNVRFPLPAAARADWNEECRMKNEELRSSSFFILHSKFFIPPPSNHRHGGPELLPRPFQNVRFPLQAAARLDWNEECRMKNEELRSS